MLFLLTTLACQSEKQDANITEIHIWHAYGEAERTALVELLEDYDNAHPEIKVSPLYITPNAFQNKLRAAAPRGNGPDLFIQAHEGIGSWVEKGLIQPIEIETQDLLPVTLEALTYEEKLYGGPMTYKSLALFVNNKLVETV